MARLALTGDFRHIDPRSAPSGLDAPKKFLSKSGFVHACGRISTRSSEKNPVRSS
jgi:hypothetical protein